MNDRMFRTLVKAYKPKGYKLVRMHGNAIRAGTEGEARREEKVICVDMDLEEPWRSLVWLHEVGHVRLKHGHGTHWREEYEAWKWAVNAWKAHGLVLKVVHLREIKARVREAIEASGDMPEDSIKYWVYGRIR